MIDEQRLKRYIEDLKTLPEPRKTIIEIMKAHRSEVHMANLLGYFFRSEENHGLGNTFIRALLNTKCYSFEEGKRKSIGSLLSTKFEDEKEQMNFLKLLSKVNVKIEDKTHKAKEKEKRLDLLLESKECVVCIEFKINHELNNPLELYQEHILKKEIEYFEETNNKREMFFVVLTPYRKVLSKKLQKLTENKKNLFSEIVLSHFIKKVLEFVPKNYFIENGDSPSLSYFKDLIQTIYNREIRFKRSFLLKQLERELNENKLKFEYHQTGRNGGFLEYKSQETKFKIRLINNRQFQFEKWSERNVKDLSFEPVRSDLNTEFVDFSRKVVGYVN